MNTSQPFCMVQLLSLHKSRCPEEVPGQWQSLADQQLLFTAHRPFPISSPVSVVYDDVLFVGEVPACEPVTTTNWRMLVRVEESLHGLQSLLQLRHQLLGTEAPRALSPPGKPTRSPEVSPQLR